MSRTVDGIVRWDCAWLLVAALLPWAAILADGPAFPEIPGFAKDGAPRTFDADSLYEYVNGDSFTYLGFGCGGVTVQEYADEGGRTITAELYDHGDADNAFGIYGYEKPPQPELLEIGGQGYLDGDQLAFFKGPYYIKLIGSGLGEGATGLLTAMAKAIAAGMSGREGLPPVAGRFPLPGLDADSIRYVATDFLGHRFLHSAFVARYGMEEGSFRAFIIQAASAEDARNMVGDYLAFLEQKGAAHEERDGVLRLIDPYNASEGAIRLQAQGQFLAGTIGDGAPEGFLRALVAKLGPPAPSD